MTSTPISQDTFAITPQQKATRQLIALTKEQIKLDAQLIKATSSAFRAMVLAARQKVDGDTFTALSKAHAAAERASYFRVSEARARLMLYNLMRGHAWSRCERNHPEGDARVALTVLRLWLAASKEVLASTGVLPEATLEMRKFIPNLPAAITPAITADASLAKEVGA